MQGDESMEAAGVWRTVGGGHSMPCEQPVQTADGHLTLSTAWSLSQWVAANTWAEWRVCLAKRHCCPALPHTQSLVLMDNLFWWSTCNFLLFWSIDIIFPCAEHCRKSALTAKRCMFTSCTVTYLPSTSGLCRSALLKQGCCSFHWELLPLGSCTWLRQEYVPLLMLLRLCTDVWCSLALCFLV